MFASIGWSSKHETVREKNTTRDKYEDDRVTPDAGFLNAFIVARESPVPGAAKLLRR